MTAMKITGLAHWHRAVVLLALGGLLLFELSDGGTVFPVFVVAVIIALVFGIGVYIDAQKRRSELDR
jgi:hypothetical protein